MYLWFNVNGSQRRMKAEREIARKTAEVTHANVN